MPKKLKVRIVYEQVYEVDMAHYPGCKTLEEARSIDQSNIEDDCFFIMDRDDCFVEKSVTIVEDS